MTKRTSPDTLIPLTAPVFHILMALADRERHGYAIMREVQAQTDGALKLGPGTLYGCIKRMLALGLLARGREQADPAMDDERRRYYRLTDLGRRVVQAEADRLARAVAAAQSKRLLSPRRARLAGEGR